MRTLRSLLPIATLLVCSLHMLAQNPYIRSNANIDSIEHALKSKKDPKMLFDLLNRKAAYSLAVGLIDSMDKPTQEMLRLAQELKNDSMQIVTYNLIGDYFLFKDNHGGALEYLFKGLRMSDSKGSNGNRCSLTLDIADVYRSSGNLPDALHYSRLGLQYLNDPYVKNTTLPSQAYQTLTLTFLEMNTTDSALFYGQRANEESIRRVDPFQHAQVLRNLGMVYEQLKDEMLAESYFRKSISYCDSLRLTGLAADARFAYAKFMFTHTDLKTALEECRISLRQSLAAGNYPNVSERADLMKRIFQSIGNKDSIYRYALIKDVYTDSAALAAKAGAVRDIMVNMRIHEIEEAGKLLRQTEERKNNLQYAAIAFGLVTFMILFFLLSHSVIANQRVIRFLGVIALLIVFEFLNLLLHPWLSEWTHHSPALMLLFMVCIAALLVPLHHKLEHAVINRLIEKNNRIRLTAAKKIVAELDKR